jgi:hypothetical protein
MHRRKRSWRFSAVQRLLDFLAAVCVGVAIAAGALINVANPLHSPQWRETQAAAEEASLALVRFDFRIPDDLDRGLPNSPEA